MKKSELELTGAGRIAGMAAEDVPDWAKKGEIRLECCTCDEQYDEIADFPPDWTEIERVRSFGQSTEEIPDGEDVNKYGDSVMDWQTHFGVCPECREEDEKAAGECKEGRKAKR